MEEKIKIKVFETDRNTFIIEKCTINGRIKLEINGKPIAFGTETREKPETASIIEITNECTGYINSANEEKISVDEYKEQYKELTKSGHYDEDIERFVFEDDEDEVKFTLFLKRFQRVYEDKETRHECELEFVKLPFSEVKYIAPKYKISGDIEDPTCTYTPNYFAMFSEIACEYGLYLNADDNKDGFSVPKHSKDTLRFLKYNGNYTRYEEIGLSCILNNRIISRTGGYQELIDYYNGDLYKIRMFILYEINKNKKVSKDTLKDVVDGLSEIQIKLSKIQPKAKSYDDMRNLRNKMSAMIKKAMDDELEGVDNV